MGISWPLPPEVIGIFQNKATGFVLDSNAKKEVYALEANGGDFQQWKVVRNADGYYVITNKATGFVLDSNAKKEVYTGDFNGGTYQQWNVVRNADGYFVITNKATGFVLDSNANKKVYTLEANGTDFQQWRSLALGSGHEPTVRVHVDTSEVPEPRRLGTEGWPASSRSGIRRSRRCSRARDSRPRATWRFLFKKDMPGTAPAYTQGSRITIAADWVKQHPEDFGMVIHELSHIIQSYQGENPGWLVEGVADYVRFVRFEPDSGGLSYPKPNSSYRDGYRTTARFLGWIEAYDQDIVKRLNRAMREGKYTDELFKESTGKDLDGLWREYVKDSPSRG